MRLERLRRAQGGAVTHQQALACGYTYAEIRTLLRRRDWDSLARGTYVLRRNLLRADPPGQHALLVASRVLLLSGDHAASRRSAALVLGLPTLGPVPALPEVLRRPRNRDDRSTSPSVRVTELHADDVLRWRGVLVSAPSRLVCDTARTPGRLVEALMVADAALRAGLSRRALEEAARRCAGWPGSRAVASVVAAADDRCESPLETLTRWVLATLGLPAPLSQVDVFDGDDFLGRVDFAWPDLGVVLEADGMSKYRQDGSKSRQDNAGRSARDDVLVKEKKRELGLRRVGLEVMRSTWEDAWTQPEGLATIWQQHVDLAADRRLPPDVVLVQSELVPTGQNGIPFPSKAARPLPPVPARALSSSRG